ncbi:Uncharacterised protein (plasmid) [Tsukamurella tyrosinosolvens]|uniref:Uncharacterized protein n=1 Tax=Tsukamurella tyrosinosolvens TaxID=57704 RepID=A0A1H4VKB7_TSUTY|nr:hypothetical protein [Tsukamurella tyrosinosolvens]KXO90964.1 hypothetical protein AXK58_21265 [Tsukamurella tyrosinosolvens]SEC80794.1 hypothetical protein SAMN04489793_3239 [Tsukamurella tyrosinosolvens]VEH90495.1 Uncharacterised protein [Tsukamurella tyrosinosolvens]
MSSYTSRARLINPGEVVAFIDPGVPEPLMGVPVTIRTVRHDVLHTRVTTACGADFSVRSSSAVDVVEAST